MLREIQRRGSSDRATFAECRLALVCTSGL